LKQLRDAVKQRWGLIETKNLAMVDSNQDQLQGEYRKKREKAEKDIDLIISNITPERNNPVDAVSETLSGSTSKE